MALKLGELLMGEGLLTQEQLDEALKCQVIFGIKLGSSLIELGFIEEGKLVKLLSKKLGVPAATRKELLDVPYSVYSVLPGPVAEKYRVIPFRLENKRLSVAMSDPTDIKAVDELAFATGHYIQPFIAPDILISYALEKYYNVHRDLRYMRVAGGFKRQPGPPQELPPHDHQYFESPIATAPVQQHQDPIAVTYQKEDGELLNIEIPAEFEGFGTLPDLPVEPATPEDKLGSYTIDKLSMDFAAARERDDIADVFIKYLGQDFPKGALFIIRGNTAVGWRGVVNGKKVKDFETVVVELGTPSVLKTVIEGGRYFMGPTGELPGNAPILKSVQLSGTDTILAIPVVMLKKVVAVVVVSAEVTALGQRLQELQKLVYKASLAFEMLIIKNKILMT